MDTEWCCSLSHTHTWTLMNARLIQICSQIAIRIGESTVKHCNWSDFFIEPVFTSHPFTPFSSNLFAFIFFQFISFGRYIFLCCYFFFLSWFYCSKDLNLIEMEKKLALVVACVMTCFNVHGKHRSCWCVQWMKKKTLNHDAYTYTYAYGLIREWHC